MSRTIYFLLFLVLGLASAASERSGAHARSPRGVGDVSQNKAARIVRRQITSGGSSVVVTPPSPINIPPLVTPNPNPGTSSASPIASPTPANEPSPSSSPTVNTPTPVVTPNPNPGSSSASSVASPIPTNEPSPSPSSTVNTPVVTPNPNPGTSSTSHVVLPTPTNQSSSSSTANTAVETTIVETASSSASHASSSNPTNESSQSSTINTQSSSSTANTNTSAESTPSSTPSSIITDSSTDSSTTGTSTRTGTGTGTGSIPAGSPPPSSTSTGSSGNGSGTGSSEGTVSTGTIGSTPSSSAGPGSPTGSAGTPTDNNTPSSSSRSSTTWHIPTNAPLVVQQAPPDVVSPVCTVAYQPVDAWASTGSDSPASSSASTTGIEGENPPTVQEPPKPSCNNGTKVGNTVGASIKLNFTGVEAALLFVPSKLGGSYSVKLNDLEEKYFDSYKEGFSACEVNQTWSVTGLPNQQHTIVVTIKGNSAVVPGSAAGGTQLEYSGLIFKGPTPEPDQPPSSGVNKWVIIGACIGGGILLIAIGITAFICVRRRRQNHTPPSQMVQNEQAAFGHNRLASTALSTTTMSPVGGRLSLHHPTPVGSPTPHFLPSPRVGPMDSSFIPSSSPPQSPPLSPRSMSTTWQEPNSHIYGPRPMSMTATEYGGSQGRPMSMNTAYTYQNPGVNAYTGNPTPYNIPVPGTPPARGYAQENPFVSGHSRNTSYSQNPFE